MLLSKLGRQCMYFFKRIRNLNIPIDLQLYLFDHVSLPIALYGCEIWGFENSQIIKKNTDRLLT